MKLVSDYSNTLYWKLLAGKLGDKISKRNVQRKYYNSTYS